MAVAIFRGTTLTDDAYIQASTPTTNAGTGISLSTGLNSTRSLIKFDISSIPSTARVTNASLWIQNSTSGHTDTFTLHRILQSWTETGVTWNTRDGSNAWDSAGCSTSGVDYYGTASATTGSLTTATAKHYLFDVTSDVQGFVSGAYSNYGWRLSNTSSTSSVLGSSDNSSTYVHPFLVVTYDDFTPVVSAGLSSVQSSSGTTLSARVPANIVAGDIIVAHLLKNNTESVSSPPSGFTAINNVATAQSHHIYWKKSTDGSESGGTVTAAWTTATTCLLALHVIRGAETLKVSSNTAYTTNNTTLRAAGVTVPRDNCLLVFAGAAYRTTSNLPGVPSGFTQVSQFGSTTPDFWIQFAYKEADAGASGDVDSTLSTTSSTKHAFLLCFTPVSAVGTIDGHSTLEAASNPQSTIDGHSTLLKQTTATLDGHSTLLKQRTDTIDGHSTLYNQRTGTIDGHSTLLKQRTDTIDGHSTLLKQRTDTIDGNSTLLKQRTDTVDGHSTLLKQTSDTIDGHSTLEAVSWSGWSVVETTDPDVETWADTTVENGKTYQYRVKAVKNSESSAYSTSGEVTFSAATERSTTIDGHSALRAQPATIDGHSTLESDAPTDLNATSYNTGYIEITWVDNSTDEYDFYIERMEYVGGAWSEWVGVDWAMAESTVWNDSDIDVYAQVPYRYRVVPRYYSIELGYYFGHYSDYVEYTYPPPNTKTSTIPGHSSLRRQPVTIDGHSTLLKANTSSIDGHSTLKQTLQGAIDGHSTLYNLRSGTIDGHSALRAQPSTIDGHSALKPRPSTIDGHSTLLDQRKDYIQGHSTLFKQRTSTIDGHSVLRSQPATIDGHSYLLSQGTNYQTIEGHSTLAMSRIRQFTGASTLKYTGWLVNPHKKPTTYHEAPTAPTMQTDSTGSVTIEVDDVHVTTWLTDPSSVTDVMTE